MCGCVCVCLVSDLESYMVLVHGNTVLYDVIIKDKQKETDRRGASETRGRYWSDVTTDKQKSEAIRN